MALKPEFRVEGKIYCKAVDTHKKHYVRIVAGQPLSLS